MADTLIIDAAGQIKSELSAVRASAHYVESEIRALNELVDSSSAIVLLHYDVRKEQTAEYIRLQLKSAPQSKVVVIAQQLCDKEILACLLAGAQGYQEVEQLGRYFERLLSAISRGEAWITRRMTSTLLNLLR